jgi:hypothetical protein
MAVAKKKTKKVVKPNTKTRAEQIMSDTRMTSIERAKQLKMRPVDARARLNIHPLTLKNMRTDVENLMAGRASSEKMAAAPEPEKKKPTPTPKSGGGGGGKNWADTIFDPNSYKPTPNPVMFPARGTALKRAVGAAIRGASISTAVGAYGLKKKKYTSTVKKRK